MSSVAAQAKARAEERARLAAAAANTPIGKPPRPVVKRASTPPVSTPTVRVGLSPAAARRQFLIASSAGHILAAAGVQRSEQGANDNEAEITGEAARVITQLEADRRRLKEIKSTEKKVEAKRGMLGDYRSWCDGFMAAGEGQRGPLDQVFTTIMAWTIDVGDHVAALPMIEHALRYKLAMPAHFERDVATFAIDQICEDAIRVFDGDDDDAKGAFPAAVLPMLQDLIQDAALDLHDQVTAKLHKALGRAIMAGANPDDAEDVKRRQAETLRLYQRAIELNAGVGVKKDIDRLKSALKKAATPSATTDTPPEQSGG